MTREEAIRVLEDNRPSVIFEDEDAQKRMAELCRAIDMAIEALQKVQKHEETFEWCHDCKEYDTDNHCCHRWSKVISNTVGELKADRPQGEWIFNPTDAIDLMFAKPKCSKCGFESSDGGNYCPNCGERKEPKGFVADEWYRDTFKGEEE